MEPENWTVEGGARVTDPEVRARLRRMIEDDSDLVAEHRKYRGSSAPLRMIFSSPRELDRYLDAHVSPGDAFYFWKFEECCRDDNACETGKVPDQAGRVPVGGPY